MKNYFIGIFPDENTKRRISMVARDFGGIFESQGIHVRWALPENFHISILFLGKDLNFVSKFIKKRSFQKYVNQKFLPFPITLGDVKLGISNRYRELIFLSIENGADELRNSVLDLSAFMKTKRDQIFIPHMTLGRVSKDLSDEEYRNLISEIARFNSEKNVSIEFTASKIEFIESDMISYRVI